MSKKDVAEEKHRQLASFMRRVLDDFCKIRGREKKYFHVPFWDVVAITTADEEQKRAFEEQIKRKCSSHDLPLGIPFHVFADPPGLKIGCGNSTFLALVELLDIYGDRLYTLRILLIHAGGLSQRLPSLSILGKLFSPIPTGHSLFQMLDLKLAMYMPFLRKMQSGVFVTCSDDIITYNLGEEYENEPAWSFTKPGFTALAHPSNLNIGTKHGVYVLPPLEFTSKTCFLSSCSLVLQKPTEAVMREKGAVVTISTPEGDEDIVYSDSAFFFSTEVTKKMIDFCRANKSFSCEIDAYGDFLQALGSCAVPDYIYNSSTVVDSTEELVTARQRIFHLLQGCDLNIVVLQQSKFYHMGTMTEYVENLCANSSFARELQLSKFADSAFCGPCAGELMINGTVIHSLINRSSQVSKNSVVEYCDFRVPTYVSENCIVSNCRTESLVSGESFIKVPSCILLHTVAVTISGHHGYVTVAFNFHDDIKKKYPWDDRGKVIFLNKRLEDIPASLLGVNILKDCFDSKDKLCSLWDGKLFEVCSTMEESFGETLQMVNAIMGCLDTSNTLNITSRKNPKLSMVEILKYKNITAMLDFRQKLHEEILKFDSTS
ncbi:fucose-1-phosphate guanylyltransferase-like [Limulus polyphemus]|uniref:Fucose-1-phosphate guanylyltransferase-like n=1 Tax=Limulus polyphemus TaxID=6850 RepID=A0ABM1B7N1_LIMPO|nr:fucose-1-phosphate guanylyltransferase-like [Limulus polyphemus]